MNSSRAAEAGGGLRLRAQAVRLCGAPLLQFERCSGGRNNRIYRAVTAAACFALKIYALSGHRGHDRLRYEFEALRFLEGAGTKDFFPRAVAADPKHGMALYEWIEGSPRPAFGPGDASRVVALLAVLRDASKKPGAHVLPAAIEACPSGRALLEQLRLRRLRLLKRTAHEPELAAFFRDRFDPMFAHACDALAGAEAALAAEHQVLSPSDFGFHNAVRRPDGSLAFIDLEYFGWDDPVKLVADFLWHPAMRLDGTARREVFCGAAGLFEHDDGFRRRLRGRFPFFGLLWALIVLNEFLPESWQRRRFAGEAEDWAAVKARQLEKAGALVQRAARNFQHGLDDTDTSYE